MNANLSADDFWAATPVERIAKCRHMAAQAARLAAAARADVRNDYLRLAKEWAALADDMQMWERDRAQR
jgi:hypothetical protein